MVRLMSTPYEVLAGGSSPQIQQAIADSLMLSGAVTGGSAFAPKPRNAMSMGIRAYHGSPHSFDKFSMSKIGTGEGAQVYGHGLYFAENEDIARGYREALKPGKGLGPEDTASRVLEVHGGDRDAAISALRTAIDRANANNAPYEEVQRLMQAKNILNVQPERATGSMYEVDIAANPEAFLDWDKPMGEQLDVASKIPAWDFRVREWLRTKTGPDPRTLTGAQFLARTTTDPAKTSARLSEAGIPGVKYLDAGSRGAGGGTRNYVVFDDKLISIVRKYGIAGASAMLGYDLLSNVSEAQAEELRRIEKAGAK
jgi:hypothetical protein